MKIIHIPAKQILDMTLPDKVLKGLPDSIALFMPVQQIADQPYIVEQLKKAGKKVELFQTRHTWNPGQILGCNVEPFDTDVEAFFYIGDGLFHPKALLMKNEKRVYCYNPRTREFFHMDPKEMESIRKRVQGARAKFFSSNSIGILVTTKTGQRGFKYKWAKKLEEKYSDKKFYYLMQNNIDFNELDNFPFIDVFLNTACERIGLDDTPRTNHFILNVEDVDDEIWKEL